MDPAPPARILLAFICTLTLHACHDTTPPGGQERDDVQRRAELAPSDEQRSRLENWAMNHPGETIELFFWLDVAVDTDRVLELQRQAAIHARRHGLASTSLAPSMATARSEVASQLQPAVNVLQQTLPSSCGQTLESAKFGPFVWCRISAGDVQSLKWNSLPAWTFETDDGPARAWCSDPGGPSHGIDDIADVIGTGCANGHGYAAQEFNVGVIENFLAPYHQNPYWTLSGPDYFSQSPVQDEEQYLQFGSGAQCIGKTYTASEHATAVAGAIGSRSEDENAIANAAYATLKYADSNDWIRAGGGALHCGALSGLVEIMDWFVDENVHVVNESFVCNEANGYSWPQERVHSFFARYYDIVITRAAGNMDDSNGGESEAASPQFHDVSCRLRNAVCVGSRELHFDNMSIFSRYKNPGDTDRDEPDVVAPGEDLELIHGSGAGCGGPCDHEFNKVKGTSFPAPALAGMVAMAWEQLDGWQGCRQSEWARAILKASAIDRNEFWVPYWDTNFQTWSYAEGPRFARHDLNIPGDFETEDDAFGAGMPQFQRMLGWCCSGESAWVEEDDMEQLAFTNLPALDRVHPILGGDHPNTNGTTQLEEGFVYVSSETEQPGRDGEYCSNPELPNCDFDYGDSSVQLRRVVVEWSECPDAIPEDPNQTPNSPIEIATDFNATLTTPSGESYWMSTSFDDTTEIFEFCATEAGAYTIQVIPTEKSFGCPRTPGDPNRNGEWLYVIESRTRNIDPETDCPELEHYGYGLQ